jgi:uncharacterized membrane-anchored protein
MAEYGVAGSAAAKMGLIAKLAALLIAFKKLIIFGVIALGALLMKVFGKKSDNS